MHRKLRVLYTNGHETLTDVQIPMLLNAGFEVVKSFTSTNYQNYFHHTPDYDNQSLEINQLWRKSCTLDDDTIDRIQKLDFMNFYPVEGGHGIYNTSWAHFSKKDKKIINEHIDVIFIGPFFYRVSLLDWFKGICVLNIYGLENGQSSWLRYNTGREMSRSRLTKYCGKWISTFFFQSTMDIEHPDLVGKNGIVFTSASSEAIRKKVEGFTMWSADSTTKTVATNMAIHNLSQENQDLFEKYFHNLNYIIYGKNEKNDERKIRGHITNYREMFEEVVKCGVFVDSSLVKSHGRYFAIECMALNMPVLFLRDTIIGSEGIVAIGMDKMLKTGMCLNYAEMRERAEKCLTDTEYAQTVVENNKIILNEVFRESRGNAQASLLYTKCEILLQNRNKKKSFWRYFLPQSS